MEASRECGNEGLVRPCLGVLLRGALGVSLIALVVGCGASGGATRASASTPANDTSRRVEELLGSDPTDMASRRGCSDASSCQEALAKLKSAVPVSPCELRRGVDVARSACELGVAEGCTELGRMKLWGIETDGAADAAAARGLFAQACELGDGEACARHGLMTLLGEGVLRDEATGQSELQAACEKYPGIACGVAAMGLDQDARQRGEDPEQELMALFAQRGCEAADAHSCQLLGDAFLTGTGVGRDSDKALSLYQRACEAGNATACTREGVMVLQSSGAAEDAHADALFSRGCALGSSEACRSLVLRTRRQSGEVKDEPTQQALFRQACEHGAAMGCLALYDSLRRKPAGPGVSLELPGLLKRACRFGEAKACEFLDDVSSTAQRQCEGGVASSCGVLGALLLSQPVQEREAADGLQLLHQACKWGDAKSCKLMRDVEPHARELTCR